MPRSDATTSTTGPAATSTAGHSCTGDGCGRPAPDGFICRTCGDQLKVDLLALGGTATVPGLAVELLVTMARQDTPLDRHGIREPGLDPDPTDQPIAEVALPFDPAAGEALAEARTLLGGHARRLLARGGLPGAAYPGDDVTDLARWLGHHRVTIFADPRAAAISADVARIVARARRIVFPQADQYMGPCGHCDCATGSCERCADLQPTQLYVEQGASHVTCPAPRCGRTWRVEDRLDWLMTQADGQLVTATEASRALPGLVGEDLLGGRPLTADKIRGWARRGRITVYRPHPHDWTVDDAGHPVQPAPRFRVGDLRCHLARIAAEGDRA